MVLGSEGLARRVVRRIDAPRIGAVALVTVLVSVRPMLSGQSLDFFTPGEIAWAWMEHLLELSSLAAVLMLAYTCLDATLPRHTPLRLTLLCTMLLFLSAMLTLVLHAYYAHGVEHLPPPLRLFADSLRFGLPAVFLACVADVHQRALQAVRAADAAEGGRVRLGHEEAEHRLAVLQAQIEPHFLFNVLGNVRRLYRTQPRAGAQAIASLTVLLKAVRPQMRSRCASLGEELETVRSYVHLFQVRMGDRLSFRIDVDGSLHGARFPPMLLITLVENAIKHGVEPVGGGIISVRARACGERLEVTVEDDGAGFGAAGSAGTGVGLANIRRQLDARYGATARLLLESREPRGACATLTIPLQFDVAGEPREPARTGR
jgi:sensor histidine kinase YesM